MFASFGRWTRWIGFFGMGSLLLLTGCPSTPLSEKGPDPDGGVTSDGGTNNDNVVTPVVECKKGTACIQVNNANVRSCDLLLNNNKATQGVQIGFDSGVIGQSKAKDTRLALAFVLKKDNALSTQQYVAVIQLKDGVKEIKIDKVICYDRKGATIDKPDVTLRRP